jgi:hypothetical protein
MAEMLQLGAMVGSANQGRKLANCCEQAAEARMLESNDRLVWPFGKLALHVLRLGKMSPTSPLATTRICNRHLSPHRIHPLLVFGFIVGPFALARATSRPTGQVKRSLVGPALSAAVIAPIAGLGVATPCATFRHRPAPTFEGHSLGFSPAWKTNKLDPGI